MIHAAFKLWATFCSPRMNHAAEENGIGRKKGRRKKKKNTKKPHFPICPSPFSVLRYEAPIIWAWAAVVKHKCWWRSDVCNSIQVFLHIKTLYGHIIKKRHFCPDWCASWFQVANGVLMHLLRIKAKLVVGRGINDNFFWGQSMTDFQLKIIKSH